MAGASDSPAFARLLAAQTASNSSAPSEQVSNRENRVNNAPNSLLFLGSIDKETRPTVSHLLRNHPDFRKDYWNIIYSEVNKEKPFTSMQEGTEVSINTSTNEIIWQDHPTSAITAVATDLIDREIVTSDEQIIIGTITKENPTVSNLLKKHKIYSDDTWKIIFSSINKNKKYSLIREGTLITINPTTFELSLSNKPSPPADQNREISAAALQNLSDLSKEHFLKNRSFAERLVDSVKPFIGRPYNEIDCYGLLVRGMRSQGVMYGGKGGLRESMEQLAMQQGLPLNAYQNGEGLIETVGSQTYTKSYLTINDIGEQAAAVFNELKPQLNEGAILSFSTPSRGHTGIISQKNGKWTYINSGLIDNQVDAGKLKHRVGEESLEEEIKNWFRLAKEQNESLKVSLGQLDEQKLQSYFRTDEQDLLSDALPANAPPPKTTAKSHL